MEKKSGLCGDFADQRRMEWRRLYEQLYCARGDMENRIKEPSWPHRRGQKALEQAPVTPSCHLNRSPFFSHLKKLAWNTQSH